MTDCICRIVDLSRGPLRRGVAYALGVVLFFSYTPSAAQTRKILDFTQRSFSALNDPIGTGATFGEVEGVPSHNALPLELRIQSVSPIFVGPQRSFLVEVLLQNTGSTSYFVPASPSAERESLRGGNRSRRIFVLQIAFLFSRTQLVSAAGSSNGSESYPNSLVELKPQESMLIRFQLDPWRIPELFLTDMKEINFSVTSFESTLQDDRDVISGWSRLIESKNIVRVSITP